jgi:hypothetical protein
LGTTHASKIPAPQERNLPIQAEKDSNPIDPTLDGGFLSCIENRRQFLEMMVAGGALDGKDKDRDYFGYYAFPQALDMDKILRYEDRVQRQLDWALQSFEMLSIDVGSFPRAGACPQ